MTTAIAQVHDELRRIATAARQRQGADDNGWLSRLREEAAARFDELGLPNAKDEAWRYTSLDFLARQRFEPADGDIVGTLSEQDIVPFQLPETETTRLVFVDGLFAGRLSDALDSGAGLAVGSLQELLADDPDSLKPYLGRAADQSNAFAALNTALLTDGAFVKVGEGRSTERPIELLHVSTAADTPSMSHPHHLIVLENGARATLIERHVSLGEAACFTNGVMKLWLGRDAVLQHEQLQEDGADTYHLSALEVTQQSGSRYLYRSAALGGAWARTDLRVTFAGEHAVAELDGLYLAGDRQLNDVHLDVRHEVPDCRSRETFKGILDGRGRAVFDGRVVVAKDAQRTDARLSNDNLMLSRNAEVDTKPQLEIYADDVRCSHGTTVGQLDEEMLFYLRSRGIGREEARRMLCLGFAGEILERFDTEGLRRRAQDLLAKRLAFSSGPTETETA